MAEKLDELRDRALKAKSWQVRNQAVKDLGQCKGDEEAKHILLAVIADRRTAVWWRRWLNDPFYQVGFTRRNAWQALQDQNLSLKELETCLALGLDDPYYEVRTATWNLLARLLAKEEESLSPSVREDLCKRMSREKNFEILTAALGVIDRVCCTETLLKWAEKVDTIKHWRVRAAYLEAMERSCRKGDLSRPVAEAILKRFNLRSEYFRPVFMLKERGSKLERSLKVEE